MVAVRIDMVYIKQIARSSTTSHACLIFEIWRTASIVAEEFD